MNNKKGFTLIELLAVIIRLGVIMLIAIPSVTRQISDSRKNAYVDTARQIVKGAIPMVNSGELDMYDTNTTYYIPASCIPTENNFSSPFGEFKDAYVIVGYTGEGYVYYWASVDEAKQGIEFKEYNQLTKNDIKPNMDVVDKTIGIGSRTDIMILNEETCQTFERSEESASTSQIIYPEGKTKATVETGNIVKIGTEDFYVVKHEENNLILLAKYNLNVGDNKYPSGDEGIQNEEVVGSKSDRTTYGNIKFTNDLYWSGNVGIDKQYPGSYNDPNYPYVFDNNSILYQYVSDYKNYLEQFNVNIKEARLLNYSEAIYLGCDVSIRQCKNAIPFFKETSYWLGSALDDEKIFTVNINGDINDTNRADIASYYYGVRPVIVI